MGIFFVFIVFFYFSNKQKQAIDSATLPLAELSAEIVFQQVTLILTGCTKTYRATGLYRALRCTMIGRWAGL